MVFHRESLPVVSSAVKLWILSLHWAHQNRPALAFQLDHNSRYILIAGETQDNFAANEIEVGVEGMRMVELDAYRHTGQSSRVYLLEVNWSGSSALLENGRTQSVGVILCRYLILGAGSREAQVELSLEDAWSVYASSSHLAPGVQYFARRRAYIASWDWRHRAKSTYLAGASSMYKFAQRLQVGRRYK